MKRTKFYSVAGLVIVVGLSSLYYVATTPVNESETIVLTRPSRDRTVTDTLTKEECGACHMAYPGRFLPGRSWTKIMAGLEDHFGEDASLDDADRTHIEDYLTSQAARFQGTPLRITELKWFTREHSERRIKKLMTKRGVKSTSNCVACHRGAERGNFDD